ncbi:hypothetical protein D3C78_1070700 [compost metagenome]
MQGAAVVDQQRRVGLEHERHGLGILDQGLEGVECAGGSVAGVIVKRETVSVVAQAETAIGIELQHRSGLVGFALAGDEAVAAGKGEGGRGQRQCMQAAQLLDDAAQRDDPGRFVGRVPAGGKDQRRRGGRAAFTGDNRTVVGRFGMWAQTQSGVRAEFDLSAVILAGPGHAAASFEVTDQPHDLALVVDIEGKGTVAHQFQQQLVARGQVQATLAPGQAGQVRKMLGQRIAPGAGHLRTHQGRQLAIGKALHQGLLAGV